MNRTYSIGLAPGTLALVIIMAMIPAVAVAQDMANDPDADPVVLKTTIDATYEYRYRSAEVLIEEAPHKNGIDLYRNVISVPPMAAVDWELGAKQGLAVGFGIELRKQFMPDENGTYFAADNFLPVGISGNPVATENSMITKGALYWHGAAFDIIFGRDKIDLGEGLKGSLYPSVRLPYLDAFQFKGHLGPLGMNWIVASLRGEASWDSGDDVDPNDGVSGGTDQYGFQGDPIPTVIIEALHRFTWDFGELQIGVAGHDIYARRNNAYTLTDFFPVMSWHQADVTSNNLTVLVDASWTPLPDLRIMGMAGLDEMDASDVGVSDSGSPTVPAWVLGGSYTGRLAGGSFDLYGECGYTHYLWGNFDGSNYSPGDVDPLERGIYRYQMDAGSGLIPLMSPYGPGATWGRLSVGYEFDSPRLRLGLELLVLSKMIDANLVDTPVFRSDSGSLNPDSPRFIFVETSLPVLLHLGSLAVSVEPAVLVRSGTWWFEAKFGATYRFERSTIILDH